MTITEGRHWVGVASQRRFVLIKYQWVRSVWSGRLWRVLHQTNLVAEWPFKPSWAFEVLLDHVLCLLLFQSLYALSWVWPDFQGLFVITSKFGKDEISNKPYLHYCHYYYYYFLILFHSCVLFYLILIFLSTWWYLPVLSEHPTHLTLSSQRIFMPLPLALVGQLVLFYYMFDLTLLLQVIAYGLIPESQLSIDGIFLFLLLSGTRTHAYALTLST